ncbi:coiled-coil domain-containing protein [Capnocytophaga cynodegmi]|uniref:hypothetical protein n=1 Tax=Capnocytophaga cynodegmi TaxID=28189 RepID=UPI00385B8E2B
MKRISRIANLYKIILIVLLLGAEFVHGQHFSKEIEGYLKSSEQLRGEGRLEEIYDVLKQAELLAENNQKDYLPEIYSEYVKYFFAIKNSNLAKEYMQKARSIAEKAHSSQAIAYGYYTQAYYYNYLDIRQLAVENCQLALTIAEENRLETLKPKLYYILYGAYSSVEDASLARKYAQKTIETANKVANYNLLSNGYSAMSTVMGYLYKKEQNEAFKDSILIYLEKSAALYKQFPNKVSPITYGITNINIADFYYQSGSLSDPNTLANIEKYTAIALEVSRGKSNTASIQANAKGLLAEIALQQGNTSEAERLLTEAFLEISKQQPVVDYYTLIALAQALSQLYEKNGNLEKALHLKNEKEIYKAKLYDQNQQEQMLRLEAEFENQQIKQQIETISQLAESRKQLNYLYIGTSVLALVSLVFVVRNQQNKAKLQNEKQLRLEKEKNEAEARALLKEKERRLLSIQKSQMEREIKMQLRLEKEEQARLKAEQELLQLKNEQMQKEVLANALQIDRKNKLLEEIKDKIKQEGNTFNIERVLKKEKFLDDTIEQTVKEFQDIHPDFFNKLSEISDNKLTSLDLKYCAYMYLKLSTKEIATAFNVEPKSIRMSKYRIKQKLNLEKEDSLEDFLQSLTA